MRLLLYTIILSVALCGCSGRDNDAHTSVQALPAESRLGDTGTQKMVELLHSYYRLKDALVESNAADADKAAVATRNNTVELAEITAADTLHPIQLQPQADSLIAALTALITVKDETTEYKRIPFSTVSDLVYSLVVKTGLEHAGIYREYCPMAFNDKGAYWLSNEAEIRNPYFGTIMLECGEVTDTL